METRYTAVHISFPYETRMDDVMDDLIQEHLETVYTKFEYLGSETDLETMQKTSTYVIKYLEDVEHIIDDALFDVADSLNGKVDLGWILGLTQEEAEEAGYAI